MKFNWKKIVTLFLALSLVFMGISAPKAVKAESFVQIPTDVNLSFVCEPGETTHIEVPFKSTALITSLSASTDADSKSIFKVESIKVMNTQRTEELNYLQEGTDAILQLDIMTKDSAKIGNYDLGILFQGQGTVYSDGVLNDIVPGKPVNVMNINLQVTTEKQPIQLTVDSINYAADKVSPGNLFMLSLTLKNEGEIKAYNTYLSLTLDEKTMIPGYSVESKKIGTLNPGATTTIDLPIEVLADALVGNHTITVDMTCKDTDGTSLDFHKVIYLKVVSGTNGGYGAVLDFDASKNTLEVKADSEIALELDLKNTGNVIATGINASVEGIGVTQGIIKGYAESNIKIADIVEGKTGKLLVPLVITKDIKGGLMELTLHLEYYSSTIKKTEDITYYLVVDAAEKEVKSENYVTISNVSQSPAAPSAGSGMTVTFNINNDGDKAITNVQVNGTGLSSSNFEPVNSEPYQTVGDIEAGKKKTVTMKFNVGKNITEGLNTLGIAYQYFDGEGVKHNDTVNLYILNVQNEKKSESVSKPKLIISNYGVDSEELRAGSTFNFEFELTNTHSEKAAKNITVTITQAEDIFSPTMGSNSFYIANIAAGESVKNALPMKVKTSTATGAYDIVLLVQYEYDEMSEADAQKGGVEESHTLKLNAIENSRPMIENIYIENYDGAYVGTDLAMSFEFYNMGMSSLNNVYVTVEGDFVLSNNSAMKYVGSLTSYMSEYVDLSVVPQVEGDAVGKIIVHFEDSTGAEITKESEFTTFVSPAQSGDFGDMGDYGGDFSGDYGGDYGGDFGDIPVDGDGTESVDEIMPGWLFIIIVCGILFISMPVTYKIIITVKKKKMLKAMDSETM